MAVLTAVLAVASCAGKDKPAKVVRKLDIEGNHAVSDRALKKKIVTEKTGWWPFAKEKPFDPVVWDIDLDRMERVYESRGYYQTDLKGHVEEKGRDVKLRVDVVEGARTVVSTLEIRGLDELPKDERETVLADLSLAPGWPFEEGRWAAIKDEIRDRLRNAGHLEATVQGEALVDVTTYNAALTLAVQPGPRYRFSTIEVRQGRNTVLHVDPHWIEDEVRVALGKDELFSDERMHEAERRVFNMGVFSTVKVSTGPPDVAAGRVPVVVQVQEAPFRTLRLGGGVGVDQIRNEARLFAEWTNRNWLGGLRRLRLRAQAGWAFLPNAYAVVRNTEADFPRNGPIFLTSAEFDQPRLFDLAPLSFNAVVGGERRLEQAYTALTGRGQVGVTWRPWVDFAVSPSYHLEGSQVDAPGQITSDVAPLVLGCGDNPCFQVVSFLEQTVTLDRRNDPLEAIRGYFGSVTLQEGGGPLQGSYDYLRVLIDGRAYATPKLPLLEDFTFAARVQGGALYPRSGNPSDSPVLQRFYAGGANSMRGFNSRRLSPLVDVAPPTAQLDQSRVLLPIGGNGMLVGNFEVRYALTENLVLAAFLDSGNVTRGRPTVDDFGRLRYAVGIGLRYRTPVGPVRADFGYRLPIGSPPPVVNAMTPIIEDRSCFGIGGSTGTPGTDGACVLHLSIGEAF